MGIDADMFNSPEWMSEALRIGNTGLWAIEVDEENGKHRMTANETMLLCSVWRRTLRRRTVSGIGMVAWM